MPLPYNLFTIYAREDARLLSELLSQLKPLEISGRIKVWSDREINPGVQWEQEIVNHLDTADIILILVSPAYYNSEYIHREEIKRAMERHNRGEAKVLPIIVRPCSFEDDPVINSLQVLPTDGKAVTDDEHWRSQDKAWLDVVNGVKRTIAVIREDENLRERAAREAAVAAEQLRKQEAERARADQARREQEEAKHAEKERLAKEQQERRADIERRRAASENPDSGTKKIWFGVGALILLLVVLFAWQPWKKQDEKPQQQPATVEKPAQPAPDQVAFEEAERTGTVAAWQQFVDKFPNSPKRPTAENELTGLKKRVNSMLREAGTFIKLDEPGKARQLLQKVLQLDPDNADAKAKLRSLR